METEYKTYELAYHLTPDLEEAGVKSHTEEVLQLIMADGGTIITSKEAKRIHLSYPIKQKHYAHFGVITFKAPGETIEKLNAQMKLQNNLLRYLLVKLPEEGKEIRTLGEQRKGRKADDSSEAKTPKNEAKPEELEKEIEDVIKGL